MYYCAQLLSGKPNNKEHDKERNEYGNDTEQCEPSSPPTLSTVISQPCTFLLQRIVIGFHLELGFLDNSLIFSQGVGEVNRIALQLGGHFSKLSRELFVHCRC